MAVDGTEPRNGKSLRRDLPREAEAEDEVGLVAAEQGRDSVPARRDDDIELRRSIADERVEGVPVAAGMLTGAEEGDDVVTQRGEERREPMHRLGHLRYEDDPHPRSK